VASESPNFSNATLVSCLADVTQAAPRRPAVLFGESAWDYEELWKRVERIAYGLLASGGFTPASRVGLIGTNTPAFLASYFGILRAGGVVVPLNHLLTADELSTQLSIAEAVACIVGDGDEALDEALRAEHAVVTADELDCTKPAPLPGVTPQSAATILFTSGSTGLPKGVVHSHATMLHAAVKIAAAFPFGREDVSIAFLPFFASIPEHVLPTLVAGGALDVLPRFDVEAVCRACARGTNFDAVPTIMARLLDEGDHEQLNRLRWVMFASETMPPPLLKRWWDCLPDVETHELYGMTEMLSITYASHETLREEPSCVGTAFSTSSVQVIDGDGTSLPPDLTGEIVCTSPARMLGYFRDPAATESALTAGGAMRTGDLGAFDKVGRLHLTGRLKNLIISGGLNIAPGEIEAVACRHPAVSTAVAVGIPDSRWGETPVVVAIARSGSTVSAGELLNHCRAGLASFKRPTGAAIVQELPVTGIGKSARNELREAIVRGELALERAR
jgi:acyl-CoA synthetase (AMP-forming)/AMP-acid ligase II